MSKVISKEEIVKQMVYEESMGSYFYKLTDHIGSSIIGISYYDKQNIWKLEVWNDYQDCFEMQKVLEEQTALEYLNYKLNAPLPLDSEVEEAIEYVRHYAPREDNDEEICKKLLLKINTIRQALVDKDKAIKANVGLWKDIDKECIKLQSKLDKVGKRLNEFIKEERTAFMTEESRKVACYMIEEFKQILRSEDNE